MEHPLAQDFTQLSDDELDKKYNELSRRWILAKRMGMDEYVLHQLDIMLNSMENEKYRRMDIADQDNPVILDTDPISTDTDENNNGTNSKY